MADNITLNEGSAGVALAAQDESSVFYQEVKLTASGGGTTEALSKAEDTAHSTGEHGIMALGVRRDADTTLAGTTGDYTPLILDANGYLKVEIFDGGGTHTVDNNGTFATQATLQAGTAAFGKLAANSGVDIGDVDVTSSALPTGAATSAAQLADGHNVTIDNASGASAVNIQDGGNTITVDGTVTANPASGTIDTVTTVTTANLAAETTKVIGTVRIASGGVASGSLASGALASGAVTDLPLPAGAATSANQIAKATGGMSYDMLAMAAEDNDKVIKGSAGTIYFISIQSIDATPVYLKLFDAASITPGTTAADLQFICPSQGTALGAGVVLNFGDHGIQFATGIVALVSTSIALDGNTAVSANEVVVTIGFE